jgi:hypothetical protein
LSPKLGFKVRRRGVCHVFERVGGSCRTQGRRLPGGAQLRTALFWPLGAACLREDRAHGFVWAPRRAQWPVGSGR